MDDPIKIVSWVGLGLCAIAVVLQVVAFRSKQLGTRAFAGWSFLLGSLVAGLVATLVRDAHELPSNVLVVIQLLLLPFALWGLFGGRGR